MVHVIQKPIALEAIRAGDLLALPRDDWSGVPNAFHLASKRGRLHFQPGAITIETMAGRRMMAEASDWLLCAENGDIFAVSQELFVERYQVLAEKPAIPPAANPRRRR